MIKIAVVSAYFGKLPISYQAWLRSCEYNPTIDFFVLTNQNVESNVPNVRVINMSLDEVRKLAEEKLGEPVRLEKPYKIADIKPMYGVILADYFKGYDYWGNCDMDLEFGDIRSFLDQYKLEQYDKFLGLGHFSLFRNTEENNLRFKLDGSGCGSWLDVIGDPDNHFFDELSGIYSIFNTNGFPVFHDNIFADILFVHRRFTANSIPNYDNQLFYWEKGKLLRDYWDNDEKKTDEFLYIHHQKRDSTSKGSNPYLTLSASQHPSHGKHGGGFQPINFDISHSDAFYIGPDGYTEKTGPSDISDVQRINPFFGEKFEKKELSLYKRRYFPIRVKRRLKRMFKRK